MNRNAVVLMAVFSLVLSYLYPSHGNSSSSSNSSQHTPGSQYVPGQIVVKLKPDVVSKGTERFTTTGRVSFDEKLARFSVGEIEKRFRHRPIPQGLNLPDLSRIYRLTFPARFNPEQVARAFAGDPHVEYAEPVMLYFPEEIPNDPLFNQQTFMPSIQAVTGWDVQHGDSNVVIAIVDTGTDWEHEDLYANIWTNETEDTGLPGVDDDENGYIDDVHGYDLADDDNDPTNVLPENDHGTHVAGLAAAVTHNGLGVAGVAWNCEIMPVKVSHDEGQGITVGYNGIIYAAENGADVINNSWGGFGYSQAGQDVIDYAHGLGSIVVCSGGNSGLEDSHIHSPSAYTNALGVGWLRDTDERHTYATYGIAIDVCAPGTGNQSTYPTNADLYGTMSGSSMSSPVVAGLCGLVKSQHPDWSVDRIVRQVVLTADNIDAQNPGFEGLLGSGRINVHSALTSNTLVEVPAKIRVFDFTLSDSSGGDGDGVLELGETFDLFPRLRNFSLGTASNLQLRLTTKDQDLDIQKGYAFIKSFPPDTFITVDDPMSMSIAPDAQPHMARFVLKYIADGGLSQSDTFSIIIGKMPLLFVDDDDGQNDVEGYYTTIFDSLNVIYAHWDHITLGAPTGTFLLNFPLVVWACEWTGPTLDGGDQVAISEYLDYGGNLFVSGQDIGWELNESSFASPEVVEFYETYLHAIYYHDDSPVQRVNGMAGDVIGDGLAFDIYQPGRSESHQYPDEIEPAPGATTVFEYNGGEHHKGGIKYEGHHKLVYFGFGFEAIDATPELNPTQFSEVRTEVMSRILEWMNFISHEFVPPSQDGYDSYPVRASLAGDQSDLVGFTLFWRTQGEPAFQQVSLDAGGDHTYEGAIPLAQPGTILEYYFETENPYYNWYAPMGAPDNLYTLQIGPLDKIMVSPDTAVVSCASSLQYTAHGLDTSGNPVGVDITWAVSPPDLGTIDEAGLFTADKAGQGWILASSDGLRDSVGVLVTAGSLAALAVTPESADLFSGESLQFTSTGYDLCDNPVPTEPVWSVSPPELGTISTDGLFTAQEEGAGWVSAFGSAGDSASVTVHRGPAIELFLSPTDTSVVSGDTIFFAATASDGYNLWDVSDSIVVSTNDPGGSFSETGYIACAEGTWEVIATYSFDSTTIADTAHVTVIPLVMCERGDVNCDAALTPGDALCAFWRAILGSFQEECACDCSEEAAEVNCDGSVTPGDALCIFWRSILGDWTGECECPAVKSRLPLSTDTFVRVTSMVALPGETITVPILVEGAQALDAFGLQLTYPDHLLEFLMVSPASETEDWTALDGILREPGVVTIGGFHTEALLSKGPIAIVEVLFMTKRGLTGRGAFDLINLTDDVYGAHTEKGRFALKNVPACFLLHQNYPNPFNPTTDIRYQIADGRYPSNTTLKIYNLLGQEIRTLVDELQNPGYYTVTWDGRDKSGSNAASGIYLYRLQAGHFTTTRKMLLMK